MKETRGSIILTRLAKKTRKETGDTRYRARAEDETASLKTLIWISSTRPFCESFSAFLPAPSELTELSSHYVAQIC